MFGRFKKKNLEEKLRELESLFEFGAIEASTNPKDFIAIVIDEIKALRAEIIELKILASDNLHKDCVCGDCRAFKNMNTIRYPDGIPD